MASLVTRYPPLFGMYFRTFHIVYEEKGLTEDEMDGWHHYLNEHEFGQALEDDEGQRSLACCSPCSRRVRHD